MAIRTIRSSALSKDTKFLSLAQASYVAPTSLPGWALIKPYSISYAGTSASIGTNGQVTFSAVTSLSLNGVFTPQFNNYVVVIREANGSTNRGWFAYRLRSSGTDNTASSYTYQTLEASAGGISAGRTTGATFAYIAYAGTGTVNGMNLYLYGPALSQATAARSANGMGYDGGYILDAASTHSAASGFDGITVYPTQNNMAGVLQVYGIRG